MCEMLRITPPAVTTAPADTAEIGTPRRRCCPNYAYLNTSERVEVEGGGGGGAFLQSSRLTSFNARP